MPKYRVSLRGFMECENPDEAFLRFSRFYGLSHLPLPLSIGELQSFDQNQHPIQVDEAGRLFTHDYTGKIVYEQPQATRGVVPVPPEAPRRTAKPAMARPAKKVQRPKAAVAKPKKLAKAATKAVKKSPKPKPKKTVKTVKKNIKKKKR